MTLNDPYAFGLILISACDLITRRVNEQRLCSYESLNENNQDIKSKVARRRIKGHLHAKQSHGQKQRLGMSFEGGLADAKKT